MPVIEVLISSYLSTIFRPFSVDWAYCSGERTGRRLLWSDSQVSISLVIFGSWVKAHVVLTCTNGVSPNRLPVIVASDVP